jgi:hypothetical protein
MRRFILLLPIVISFATSAIAGNRFFVRVGASASTTGESAEQLLERLGLHVVRSVAANDGVVYVVRSELEMPESVIAELLDSEPRIGMIESVRTLRLPEAYEERGRPSRLAHDDALTRAARFARDQIASGEASAPGSSYRRQALLRKLRLDAVHRFYDGAATVAIIDTGVDPAHPELAGSLVAGYDFILDRVGASEWSELDPRLSAQLQQSTVAVLDQSTVAVLDQSTVAVLDRFAILNQSTVAVLDQESFDRLSSDEYRAFGHGTLVAGLVHLVAPGASIMPLRAFRADGSSSTDDIVDAIYYAVAHGADVINMSFSFESFSPEVMRAVNAATRQGVICVSAAGNRGEPLLVYPASLANVTGVAALTATRERSSLSNFGEDLVSIAAPGEEVLTTYPGGRYASVFGTSFSAAIVSGSIALLREVDGEVDQHGAEKALAMGRPRSGEIGHGELNLIGALRWLRQNRSDRDDDDD